MGAYLFSRLGIGAPSVAFVMGEADSLMRSGERRLGGEELRSESENSGEFGAEWHTGTRIGELLLLRGGLTD